MVLYWSRTRLHGLIREGEDRLFKICIGDETRQTDRRDRLRDQPEKETGGDVERKP